MDNKLNVNKTGRKSLDRLGRDQRVREIYHDSDGYWLYTTAGFRTDPETHTLHEDTVSELIRSARSIDPCDCAECQNELVNR